MKSDVQSIRLDHLNGEVACYVGTTKICSVNKELLNLNSSADIEELIKINGSISMAIKTIQESSSVKRSF
ncbi:hypothetical protein [Methylotenera versatilis]|uniref:hypothetical protein n=1 Tax=Methylotenera versatilis TaxID=1055487 RepID=UPI000646DD09|nr:hypothetical protein [Methylotenera versatilis]